MNTLADCEAIIDQDPNDYTTVGPLLAAIRDGNLHPHGDFAQYCQDRWHFTISHAWQFIASARAAADITNAGLPAPANEYTARALAYGTTEDRVQVWKLALEIADTTPTSATVRAARNQLRHPQPTGRRDTAGRRIPGRSQRDALSKGISALQGLCQGLGGIDTLDAAITKDEAAQWVRDLDQPLRVLRSLTNKLKEHSHGSDVH